MASIIQLQYALELARQKSFVKAAKKCFVTQPTLSMQIQKLEEEYEIIIFDRTRKPIEPTLLGEALLTQFRKVLEEFSKIEQIANEAQGELSGDYKIAIIPTIAPSLLPKFLKNFCKKYPKVLVSAVEMTTDQIVQGLKDGEIDAGILSTPLNLASIHEHKLFNEPLCLFHSKDIQVETNKKGLVDIDGLAMDKILVLTEGNCLRTQVLDLCSLKDKSKEEHGFEVEASSLMTLLNMIQEGSYFTVIPHMASLALSKSVREKQVKNIVGSPIREVGLATHRSQIKARIHEAAAEVISELVDESFLNSGLEQLRLLPS